MSASETRVIAVVPLFTPTNAWGKRAELDAPFNSTTVLGHTLQRLSQCEQLDGIVLVHEQNAAVPSLPDSPAVQRLAQMYAVDEPLKGQMHASRIAARRFAPLAWRGGLGGATCYDEVLATGAIVQAVERTGATAAVLVGPDWPLVDPQLCDAVVARHRNNPDRLKLVFTQAPPGLAGCLIDRDLISELHERSASIGALLDYQPRLPQGDPIGKDPCVQIEPVVRNAAVRATFDLPRWQRVLRNVEAQAGQELMTAESADLVPLLTRAVAASADMPQQVTVELTTARSAIGPIVPQHHVTIDRAPMQLDQARRLFDELGQIGDVAVTFGGLGDPLLHPDWSRFVTAAAEAGVAGIHVQTDLLVEQDVRQQLLDLPIEVVSVNLPADTPETYERLMGVDAFATVRSNLEWLLNRRREPGHGRPGLPWIVPRFLKTPSNVEELESFFDRWVYWAGHAVVESPTTGGGLMPDRAVLNMAPPQRFACRQLRHRVTVHADGRFALCDQDWTCQQSPGDVGRQSLAEAWAGIGAVHGDQLAGKFETNPLCAACREWHRP